MKFLIKDAYQEFGEIIIKKAWSEIPDNYFTIRTKLVLKKFCPPRKFKILINNLNRFYLNILPNSIFHINPITFIKLTKIIKYIQKYFH